MVRSPPGRHTPWQTAPPEERPSLGRHPPRQTPPGRHPEQIPTPQADTPWTDTLLGRHLSLSRHPPWTDTPPGQIFPPRQTHPLGRHPPSRHCPPPPPKSDGYCSGRYSSYWNAFLFFGKFDKIVCWPPSGGSPPHPWGILDRPRTVNSNTANSIVCLITARKRSLRRLCFYTCLSVILFTEGVPGQVHPQAGTPPGQVHLREQCMLGDTGNKRAVRILLECILV